MLVGGSAAVRTWTRKEVQERATSLRVFVKNDLKAVDGSQRSRQLDASEVMGALLDGLVECATTSKVGTLQSVLAAGDGGEDAVFPKRQLLTEPFKILELPMQPLGAERNDGAGREGGGGAGRIGGGEAGQEEEEEERRRLAYRGFYERGKNIKFTHHVDIPLEMDMGVLGQARLDDEIWYKLFRMRDL
eukprot:jgi/Undpi1/6641/HiC_scaffold_20.g09120.m1